LKNTVSLAAAIVPFACARDRFGYSAWLPRILSIPLNPRS
jgi:hypothetical protein